MAALTINVDLSEVLDGQQIILATLARIETKVDQLMSEAGATQADVQALADQVNALSGRVESAIVILQEFQAANSGGPVNLGPISDALAHLTGDVAAVEGVAAAETPPAPPAP